MSEAVHAHPQLEQLQAFSLGKLDDDAASAVIEAHLETCSECRHKLENVPGDTLDSLVRSSDTISAAAPPLPLADHPRYQVRHLLGAGGMGTVYQARHKLMDREVAIKIMNPKLVDRPDTVERFRREVRAAARLAHPNIVTAYDAEQSGDLHFLIMEYVAGRSLAQVLAERGPLPIAEACDYIRQTALGLQHAHEQGMIHRDIKPANLLIVGASAPGSPGVVKIVDFGLARLASDLGATAVITQEGCVMGTPDYIAPEQADPAGQVDSRADIYSLGCTLYQLLAGRPPFPSGSMMQKLMAHQTQLAKPLTELRPDVPAELARVIDRMMAKDPAQRYQTPAEVAAALAGVVAQLGRPAQPPKPAPQRRRVPVLVAIALLLLVGGGVLFQVIIRITDKEGKTRDIELKPGETAQIIDKGPAKPPDRRVAEWVLACGGKVQVRVNEKERLVTAAKDLPEDPFPLIRIDLTKCKTGVTDAALEPVKGLTELTHLSLGSTPITDAGLQHVKGLTSLVDLYLGNTAISDAGLANLKGLTKLQRLVVFRTRITDTGLEHLKGLTDLVVLDLGNTQVSDAGLKHFKGFTKLVHLDLVCRNVTDAGLESLQGLVLLEGLDLSLTKVTDAGLDKLKGLTKITSLSLSYTPITDAGLDKLKGRTNLATLSLAFTAITDAGLEKLKDLTGLKVLNLGGTKVTADGLKRLRALSELTTLYLSGAQVSEAAVDHLQGLPKLRELHLYEASSAIAERLRKALPNCKVVTY